VLLYQQVKLLIRWV